MIRDDLIAVCFCRDEAGTIRQLVDSVQNQTVKAKAFVVVDDGSTDGTTEILEEYADIHLFKLPDKGRVYGTHTLKLFLYAVHKAEQLVPDWRYLLRLDADLHLTLDYTEQLLERMEANPRLGAVSGVPYSLKNGAWHDYYTGKHILNYAWDSAKLFRRRAHRVILKAYTGYGWDTLRDLLIWYNGMRVKAFQQVRFYDYRPNILQRTMRRWAEIGFCRSRLGFGFRHQFVSAFRRLLWKPRILGATTFILAYLAHRAFAGKLLPHDYYRFARAFTLRDLYERMQLNPKQRRFSKFLTRGD